MRPNSRQNLYLHKSRPSMISGRPEAARSSSGQKAGNPQFHYTPLPARKTPNMTHRKVVSYQQSPSQRISPGITSKYSSVKDSGGGGHMVAAKLLHPSQRNSSHETDKSYPHHRHHAPGDSLNESGLKNYLQDMKVAQSRLYQGTYKTRVSTARTSIRGTNCNLSPNLSGERKIPEFASSMNQSGPFTRSGGMGKKGAMAPHKPIPSAGISPIKIGAQMGMNPSASQQLMAKQQLNLLELRRRTGSNESMNGKKNSSKQQTAAIQLKQIQSPVPARADSLQAGDTYSQMTEVLKKLNIGEASEHLVKYMGQHFKPQGRKEKEDEQVARLRSFLQFLIQKRVISNQIAPNTHELGALLKTLEHEQHKRARSLQKQGDLKIPHPPPISPANNRKSSSHFILGLTTGSSGNTPREGDSANCSSPSLQQALHNSGIQQTRNSHARSKSSQLGDPQPAKPTVSRGVGAISHQRKAQPSLEEQWRARERSGSRPEKKQQPPTMQIDIKIPRLGISGSQTQIGAPNAPSGRAEASQSSYQNSSKRQSGIQRLQRSQRSLPPSNLPADTGGSSAGEAGSHTPKAPVQAAFQFQPRTRNKKGGETRESSAPVAGNESHGYWSGQSQKRKEGEEGEEYMNDSVVKERESLISYSKLYINKHNELPPTTLDFYKMIRLIGKGAFGKVTLAVHKLTGKYVAVKMIEKAAIKDDYSRRKVFQEVYILKKSRHNNVAKLLEIFESPKHLHMVMDYAAGGDLLQFVKKRKRLEEKQAKFIFKQIVYGLAHIHSRSVIHRDVKLDNILIDGDFTVKICDFGVSKIIRKDQLIKDQCGTPAYIAPEIVADQGYRGFSVDLWSLGVLLFAMVSGTVPFKAPSMPELHKLILKAQFSFPHGVTLSKGVRDLISRLIVLSPSQRLTIPQLLHHPWVCGKPGVWSEPSQLGSSLKIDRSLLLVGEEHISDEEDDFTTIEAGLKMPYIIQGKDSKAETQREDGALSLHQLIDTINLDNLFQSESQAKQTRLSYRNYCLITQSHMQEKYDEEALSICESYGYPREFVIRCLRHGDLNHATTSYFLLT